MKRTSLTIILLIALCTSISFAQMHKGGPGKKDKCPMKGEMMRGKCDMKGPMGCMPLMRFENDQFLKKAGVPDKERASIRETLHNVKKSIMDIHFQMKESFIALKGEYAKGALDENKIDELNDKISKLKKNATDLTLGAEKTIMKMLTAEQRAKLTAPMKEKGSPMHRMHE